jgi:translation initiation factor 4E
MLAAIGETFDPALTEPAPGDSQETEALESLITGVIVSSRPQFFRLSIWTRQAPNLTNESDPLKQRIEAIGKHFKTSVLGYEIGQKLGGPLATEVEFQSHKDSEKKGKGKRIVV